MVLDCLVYFWMFLDVLVYVCVRLVVGFGGRGDLVVLWWFGLILIDSWCWGRWGCIYLFLVIRVFFGWCLMVVFGLFFDCLVVVGVVVWFVFGYCYGVWGVFFVMFVCLGELCVVIWVWWRKFVVVCVYCDVNVFWIYWKCWIWCFV